MMLKVGRRGDSSRGRRRRYPRGQRWVLRDGSWLEVLVPSREKSMCSVEMGPVYCVLVERTSRHRSGTEFCFNQNEMGRKKAM